MRVSKYYTGISTSSFIIFLLICTAAYSQEVIEYKLQDVIRIAQEQSPDAQIAKHRYRQSYWSYRSFKATYLPGLQLDATLPNINRSFTAVSSQDGSTFYTPQSLQSYSVSLSVNQKIGFSGGEIFLSSGIQRMDNNFKDSTVTQYLTNMVNIGIRQPLFTYNAYRWDRKIEPMRFEEAQRLYIETNEQVAITAVNHFFSLLLAQIELGIAGKNYANYDTLYKIALGRYNLGKIAENELLQLELNLLQAEAEVENAELNYTNTLFIFKSYLRLKIDNAVKLIPPDDITYFDVPVEKAIIEAENNTSSGLEFQRRMLEAGSQLNRAKREGRFDAELFASFGLTQTSNDISMAYVDPLDEEHVTLGISLPLLDWGKARGNIKMAESSLDLVATTIEQERIDFEHNVFLKVMQFNMQKKQLRIAAKSDTVAQKRFEVTQKRYMIGKVNDVLELNNAQIDNDRSKINYFRSLETYWKSYFELRKLTLYDFKRDIPIVASFDNIIN
ncbi:MAG: TolC family protein [Bacteroidetes bacterium]|nr:MAG: TolC family protein [Bacteroidota bacterium]